MARPTRPPIWNHPAPGQRSPKLTRERIAEVAVAIADAEGYEAVSMRRIADDLGVGTMTLYYYVRTKHDLVDLMDDHLMAEALVPAGKLPKGWRAALGAIARASQRAFLAHPWALRALSSATMGPNGLKHVEQSMQAVAEMPLDTPQKLQVLGMVDDFVFGHVVRATETWVHGTDKKSMKSFAEFTTKEMRSGAYPALAALLGDQDPLEAFYRFSKMMGAEDQFEIGLETILDGIELRLERASKKRRASPRRRP